jgi:hypothetical protein
MTRHRFIVTSQGSVSTELVFILIRLSWPHLNYSTFRKTCMLPSSGLLKGKMAQTEASAAPSSSLALLSCNAQDCRLLLAVVPLERPDGPVRNRTHSQGT